MFKFSFFRNERIERSSTGLLVFFPHLQSWKVGDGVTGRLLFRLCLGANLTNLEVCPVPHCSGRTFASSTCGPFSGSIRCGLALVSCERRVTPIAGGRFSARKRVVEKLWRKLLADPSQWWDNRSEKISPGYPDFKHKKTQQSLWLTDSSNPPWIELELAAMAPGTLQSSIFSWNKRLERNVKSGNYQKTMETFRKMQREGINPDKFTFSAVLAACSSSRALDEGKRIHLQIIQTGYDSDAFVATCLVNMYSRCRSIEDARAVFNKMPKKHVWAWNAMILGHVKCGESHKVVELFRQMQREGVDPDPVTFVRLLKACASIAALEEGRHAHKEIIEKGYELDVYVGSSLVDMYAKCGCVKDAWRVFNNLPVKDVVAWTAMILGNVKCGEGQKALELFRQMQRDGPNPNPVSFIGAVNACASIGALREGRNLHKQIMERGYESDVYVASSLVDMYAKCGSTEDARRVFNKMPTRSAVAWTAMILGYVKSGEGQKALDLSRQMQRVILNPNPVTFVAIVNACASVGALEEGRCVHEQIVQGGHESNVFVGSALVDMYAKCGSIEDALKVFNKMPTRNVVAWTAMIAGYVKCGEGQKALELSQQMQHDGVNPNPVTFVGMVNACASLSALEEGRDVHDKIIERGHDDDIFVGTALIDMYTKCGSIDDAWTVFNKMPTRNVVAWSSMIVGFVKCGEGLKALELFRQMQQEGIDPNVVTYVGVLNACACMAALEEGKNVHGQIIERGYESDCFVGSSLVDMYAKCGSIEDARRVFNKMCTKSEVCWSVMLAAYAKHGYAQEALEHFEQMYQVVEVDGITFLSLLTACSHGGFVDEGLCYLDCMTAIYNISPTVEHSACVVDLLGRAGRLHEAEALIRSIPYQPNAFMWMSLLSACRVHGNVDIGERGAKHLLELEPESTVIHVLLSNIYAAAGKWSTSAIVMRKKLERRVKNNLPGLELRCISL